MAIGHANSSSRVAIASRGEDTTTAMSSHHDGSSTRTQETPRSEATTSQTRRSHHWGLASPLRMLGWQRSTQSHLRGRSTPAATIPSTKEIPSLARILEIAMTSPRTSARGLAMPRATTTISVMASDTSVSYISFDYSRSTQAHPHTHVGSPISIRELEPEPTHRVNQRP